MAGAMVAAEFVWTPARSGQEMQALNRATGEVMATVPRGGAADVDAAVAAARAAFEGPWSKFSPYERQCVLLRIADLFETH